MSRVSIDPSTDIATPAELAADYKTTKPTALSWFHKGIIPAVVADGRVIRFSRSAVAKALSDHANRKRTEAVAGAGK